MPIKTESDGLFESRRRVIPCQGDPQTTAAEFQKWAEEMNAARPWGKTFDDFLDAFEAEGKRFATLEPHQMTVDDEQLRQLARRDAREVLRLVDVVRHAREQGDIDAALMETVRLTRTHQRMTLRGAAPLVRSGKAVDEGRRTAADNRRVPAARRAQIIAAVEGGMTQKRAGEVHGYSRSTVWNIMRDHREKT